MFSAVLFVVSLSAAVLGAPSPDQLPVNYSPGPAQQQFVAQPQQQFVVSQPQPQQFVSQPQYQPQPQPQPQYQPQPSFRPQPAPQQYANAPPKYDFTWAVKDDYSRNDFGQTESRDGYNTKGSYFVLLPDGRRQTVTYYVNGDSGFVADVKYEGVATYPEPKPFRSQPQPSYQPQPQPQPQPSYQPQPQQPQYPF